MAVIMEYVFFQDCGSLTHKFTEKTNFSGETHLHHWICCSLHP